MNGSAVRDARKARGLTLSELSAVTGIAVSTISEIERGHIESPNYEIVVTLAAALGVEPASLWPVDLPQPAQSADPVNS